jgi:hypothetical protein
MYALMDQERFFQNFILGVTPGQVSVDNRTLNYAAVHKLFSSATHTLSIISRNLDHTIFDQADIISALSDFIRRGSYTKVQILVYDTTDMIKRNHRLGLLAEKAPSKIMIRTLPGEMNYFNESMVIADKHGFIHNQQSDKYEGIVSFNDSQRCLELHSIFNGLWDRSLPDPNLRQLKI